MVVKECDYKISLGQVMDCRKFSDLQHLLTVTLYVLNFTCVFKLKAERDHAMELTTGDVVEAEKLWL